MTVCSQLIRIRSAQLHDPVDHSCTMNNCWTATHNFHRHQVWTHNLQWRYHGPGTMKLFTLPSYCWSWEEVGNSSLCLQGSQPHMKSLGRCRTTWQKKAFFRMTIWKTIFDFEGIWSRSKLDFTPTLQQDTTYSSKLTNSWPKARKIQ